MTEIIPVSRRSLLCFAASMPALTLALPAPAHAGTAEIEDLVARHGAALSRWKGMEPIRQALRQDRNSCFAALHMTDFDAAADAVSDLDDALLDYPAATLAQLRVKADALHNAMNGDWFDAGVAYEAIVADIKRVTGAH